MSTTLPPLPGSPAHDHGPAPGRDPGRPPRRGPGRRGLAALLTASALLGGGVSAGVLAATGALDGGTTRITTVVQSPASEVSAAAATSTAAAGTGLDASALYAAAAPGVVEIAATGDSAQPGPFGSSQSSATGSGFVLDTDGYILTAAHVVDDATDLTVTFADGTSRGATLVGKDDATDVAVIRVDPSGLTLHPLALGSSADLRVGDAVAAIGSPFGYEGSLSTGIVSGLDRTIEAPNGFTVAGAIQIDAAINPGNSGGPVLDADGRVIGIADQIATGGTEQSSGVGFLVPIDLISHELGQLKAGQAVTHAYLGVSTGDATGTAGATVGAVSASSPAERAGLRAGDVVTAFDGTRIGDSGDLVAAIAAKAPGDAVTLGVTRGSQTVTLRVTLGPQPASRSGSIG